MWCEEFGSLKVGYEGGSSHLVGCVIDGKAYGDTVSISTDVIKETTAQPKNYVLYQNYPNPFNPSTKIRYYLPQYSHVSLRVFDMLGNEISILIDEYKDKGMHEAIFDSGRLASGCYLCRFKADNYVEAKKLILLK